VLEVHRSARFALYAGTAACVVGLSKAHALTYRYTWSGSSRFAWSLGYVLVLSLAAYAFGLPDQTSSRRASALAATGATVTGAMVVSVAQLFVGDALLPRFVVFGSVVVLIPWYVLCAQLARDVRSRAGERDRVVVVARPDDVTTLRAELEAAPERTAIVVGAFVPSDARSTSMPPARPLVDAARATAATVVVLDRGSQSDDDIVMQAAALHAEGVRVRTLSLFYEQWLGKLPIAELERVSLLFDVGELHEAWYARIKRLVDIALASAGFVVLALLTPVVALGDLFANRGPLLYRQPRVGRNGKEFDIVKFRTMRAVGEEQAHDWTREDDVRITRFGGLLRRTHLDELPQVLNVLRGELAIVGPRPEQPQLVAELVDKIPFYGIRHLVRPGLTGWAQVKFQYAGTDAEALEKLQYEFYYLRRQCLRLDLRIVGRTLRSVIGRDGR
jgi:lipopolysaccharide/colanic/teichoic acid biosynthesis glycosyltransferase